MASATAAAPPQQPELGRQDQTLLVFARLMEGGLEDEETVAELGKLTKLLNDDVELVKKGEPSVTSVIDGDCVDTILCYLDMRQADIVRGHATLCTSAYLKAAGDEGGKMLAGFFHDRVRRATYDDYIVAFCVAAAIFPIVPDLTSELFLSEGFLGSLGPLMRRKWKSRKVETACLEMLNAACMQSHCREAVQKYCSEWLEEIIDQDPEEVVKGVFATDPDVHVQEGSISMRKHSLHVQNLAAVVLAKLRAVRTAKPPTDPSASPEPRVQAAETSVEDLSKMFTKVLINNPEHSQSSIEGLAYSSLQPQVRENLSKDKEFLQCLLKTLDGAPPKSPLSYGALSILANLTVYQPVLSEEEKKMQQLKAYANAAGKWEPEPLNNHEHVTERCKRVFEAGATPVLVSYGKKGSVPALSLVISIINSLSMTPTLRGQLAQQGAVRLLIAAWLAIPEAQSKPRRTAAQALARILITTNPSHVFGGTRPIPQSNAIRPLASIIMPDPNSETRDLLSTFEALMALTNLASTDDDTRHSIVRIAWNDIEEQLMSSNSRVTTAAVELICNLVQSTTDAIELYATGKPQANNRLSILVALADAEDVPTRSAAGGALASLTNHEAVVRAIAMRDRGPEIVLGLCGDDNEDLRHRGAFVVYNMACMEGAVGELARDKLTAADGIKVLTECVRRSRRAEVVEIAAQALGALYRGGDDKT